MKDPLPPIEGDISEFAKKCAVILINEIAPRARKLDMTPNEFMHSSATGFLARLEYEGIITRRDLRVLLDNRMKELQDEQRTTS